MKNVYKNWPEQELADELFAMRRAVEEHPEDAARWASRLAQAEKEAKRRTPKPRRYREPLAQRFARLLVAPALVPEPDYRDFSTGARYVVEDDRGELWGIGPADECAPLNVFRRGHLACIRNSRRERVLVMTEWEYPDA